MSFNNTLFVTMPIDEFKQLMKTIVKNELKELSILIPQKSEPDELLDIEEAKIFLKVSKVTIHKWKKTKRIQSYRIGRKIYFKKHELLNSMNLTTVKNKTNG